MSTLGVFKQFILLFAVVSASAILVSGKDVVCGAGADFKFDEKTQRIMATPELWSNPATWGGQVPGDNADVVIPANKTVILDVSTARLKTLKVLGELTFDRRDVNITAKWIMIYGALRIGTQAEPFQNKATITLIGNDRNEDVVVGGMSLGTKFLAAMPGGRIEMFGQVKTSWTRINATAVAGANQIILANRMTGWRRGDRIIIAPNDYSIYEGEERTIAGIQGNRILLDQPLQYTHYGNVQRIGAHTLDARAEVGLLKRNIVVQGENVTGSKFGAHLMFIGNAAVKIDGIEVRGAGQAGILGRYPIHFHFGYDAGSGSFVRNSAVHHSFQRGFVIHRTNNLVISNNVVYDTVGHQYFTESSIEKNNLFERNLGILARFVPAADRVDFLDDGGDGADPTTRPSRSATFWISGLHNRYIDNVAVGVQNGMGFWFVDGRRHPERDADLDDHPDKHLLVKEFRGNIAHTIARDPEEGDFNLGYGPVQTGSCLTIDEFPGNTRTNPETGELETAPPFLNFTGYKCHNAGVWFPGAYEPIIDGGVLADSRVGGIASQGFVDSAIIRNSLIWKQSPNHPLNRNLTQMFDAMNGAFGHGPALDPANGTVEEGFILQNTQILGY